MDDWEKLSESKNILERIAFNQKNISDVKRYFKSSIDDRIVLLQSENQSKKTYQRLVEKFLLEAKDFEKEVYIPNIYNNQNNSHGGLFIYNTMRYVIENCSQVAIAYNSKSDDIKFNYGQVLMNNKPILLLNPKDIEDADSFGIMIDAHDYMNYEDFRKECHDECNHFTEGIKTLRNTIKKQSTVPLNLEYVSHGENKLEALDPASAIFFGMVYAARKPFIILNKLDVKMQSMLERKSNHKKSCSQVALFLDKSYDITSKN